MDEVTKVIEQQMRSAIRWDPKDPSALAYAIINNVEGKETRLVLDGREYMIRRVP